MSKLLNRILERAQCQAVCTLTYKSSMSSPPPELATVEEVLKKKKKRKRTYKYQHVPAKVDTSPPPYLPSEKMFKLQSWHAAAVRLNTENVQLVTELKKVNGKVDTRWKFPPRGSKAYYETRVNFLKNVTRRNWEIYNLLNNAQPKVVTTASLKRDWQYNRKHIIEGARGKFVLFPPIPHQDIEDPAFLCPDGVKRPKVYMTLKMRNHSFLGTLVLELFTDVCPNTCKLFMDLFEGDGVGYGYVGTKFFRKVPEMFWRGGDVIYNNGHGCYAQKGRWIPIGAENFHFTHSMPGLLSMSVTKDDEMCGIFNIIFKPVLQFDLHHVVFGRVIRSSSVFESLKVLGAPLSSYPEIEIESTKHKVNGVWVYGKPNTNFITMRP